MAFNYYADKENGIWGIYAIVNKVNGILYIGKHQDILKRFEIHKYNLRNNKHYNEKLQFDWNIYGEENFDFVILYRLPEDKKKTVFLNYAELFYIYKKYVHEKLYNVRNNFDFLVFIESECLTKYDGISWNDIKIRERGKAVLDILYKDELSNWICIDYKDPNDPRNLDQDVIEKHKKYCQENNISFRLVPFKRYHTEEDFKPQKREFKVYIK